MPRSPSVLPTDIIKAIEDNQNVFQKGIPIPSDSIWTKIATTLNNLITPKHLYTIVKNNRYNVQKVFAKEPEITIDNVSSDESEIEMNKMEENMNFNITLSVEEWKEIGPKIKKYNCQNINQKNYHVLEPYQWTNVIHKHFHAHSRIPCAVSYKRANVHPEGNIYLKIVGNCSSCNSRFTGEIENEPGENSLIIIKCMYQGMYKECKGKNKRLLIGRKRDELKNKMIKENMSASYIQRIEAKEIMHFGEKEPSQIPTLNSLRVLKSKALQKENLHNDPIISISILKQTNNFNSTIRDIGYDRFFIHYWSGNELNVYRQYVKQNDPSIISIDATGGVVQRPILISGRKTANIFLYEVVVMDHTIKRQYGVAHMLSERHDTNSITHWLQEWLKDGAPCPKIVVMDQSMALMSASVKSFTQYSSFNMYLDVCSSWIIGDNKYPLPKTMLRNDFNHIMKLLSSWPEFKTSSYRIKNFYLRSIALVIQSKDFETIKYLLKSIFIVALFETEGINEITGEPNLCERYKTELKIKIASIEDTPNDQNDYDISEFNQCEIDLDINIPTSDPEYFKNIKLIYYDCVDLSKVHDKGDRDNHQHNIQIAKRLLQFCKLLPCWTAVMVPFFGFGNLTHTSASSESQFNDLKNRVFKHTTLPLRVDRFLTTHINSFTGTMNLVASDINNRGNRDDENVDEKIQMELGENVLIQTYDNQQMEDEDENVRTIKINENLLTESEENVNQQKYLPYDQNQSKQTTTCIANENICIVCINGHKPTGAHRCNICKKAVHIIGGCSYNILGEEEGFGEKRNCHQCKRKSFHNNELNAEENWRGETEKNTKKSNYLQKDPTILFYNDSSKTKSPVIGIFKNGNRSNLKSIQIDGKFYISSNTCAFDSIIHILCTSYCDSKPYAKFINSNNDKLVFKLISNAIKDGINVQTYRKRSMILKNICRLKELPEQLICIQADTTIEFMARNLLEPWPSRVDTQNCISCPRQQINQQPILINVNDIQNLNALLLADGSLNKCYQCNRRLINPYK